MNLPDAFKEKMEQLLQDEYPAYLACFEEKRYYGLRVNISKISAEEFLQIPVICALFPTCYPGTYSQI